MNKDIVYIFIFFLCSLQDEIQEMREEIYQLSKKMNK